MTSETHKRTVYIIILGLVEVCWWRRRTKINGTPPMSLKRISAAIYPLYLYSGQSQTCPFPDTILLSMPFVRSKQVHGRSDSRDKIESESPCQSISAFSITESPAQPMQTMQVCLLWDKQSDETSTKVKFTTFQIPQTRSRVMVVYLRELPINPQRSDKGGTASL